MDEAGCDVVMPEQKEIARRIGVGRLRPMGTGQGFNHEARLWAGSTGPSCLPGWLQVRWSPTASAWARHLRRFVPVTS